MATHERVMHIADDGEVFLVAGLRLPLHFEIGPDITLNVSVVQRLTLSVDVVRGKGNGAIQGRLDAIHGGSRLGNVDASAALSSGWGGSDSHVRSDGRASSLSVSETVTMLPLSETIAIPVHDVSETARRAGERGDHVSVASSHKSECGKTRTESSGQRECGMR